MVNGYRTGADALVDEVALAPHRGRDLIYPVVFLYRHSLELHLKQILADYGDQAGVAADFKDHRLDRLWQKCQRTLVYFFPNEDRETLKVVDALVDEFMAIDERSVVFRYSTDTRGLELPLPLTDPDLHALRRSVAAVANFLECCEWAMHERCTAC